MLAAIKNLPFIKMFAKPYNLLIITALLFFIVSFVVKNQSLDVHIYDTYYVIDFAFVFRTLTVILFIYWLLYNTTKRFLFSSFLSWAHIVATILTAILVVTFSLWGGFAYKSAQEGFRFSDYEKYRSINTTIASLILALLFTQFTYFLNLIIGLLKKL